jgi:hypothetical protein
VDWGKEKRKKEEGRRRWRERERVCVCVCVSVIEIEKSFLCFFLIHSLTLTHSLTHSVTDGHLFLYSAFLLFHSSSFGRRGLFVNQLPMDWLWHGTSHTQHTTQHRWRIFLAYSVGTRTIRWSGTNLRLSSNWSLTVHSNTSLRSRAWPIYVRYT